MTIIFAIIGFSIIWAIVVYKIATFYQKLAEDHGRKPVGIYYTRCRVQISYKVR
jgi:hypothetical protein